MNYYRLDSEILSSVQGLNGDQKSDILTYIRNYKSPIHSHQRYRRKAMRQIREALKSV